jgi:hypothetical protein
MKGRYSEFDALINGFQCVLGSFIATELAKNDTTFNFCQFSKSSLMTIAILLSYVIGYCSLSSICILQRSYGDGIPTTF